MGRWVGGGGSTALSGRRSFSDFKNFPWDDLGQDDVSIHAGEFTQVDVWGQMERV